MARPQKKQKVLRPIKIVNYLPRKIVYYFSIRPQFQSELRPRWGGGTVPAPVLIDACCPGSVGWPQDLVRVLVFCPGQGICPPSGSWRRSSPARRSRRARLDPRDLIPGREDFLAWYSDATHCFVYLHLSMFRGPGMVFCACE